MGRVFEVEEGECMICCLVSGLGSTLLRLKLGLGSFSHEGGKYHLCPGFTEVVIVLFWKVEEDKGPRV